MTETKHVCHKYKVSKASTFGLKHVHAVLTCEGTGGRPCSKFLIRLLPYSDLECKSAETSERKTYYWYDKSVKGEPNEKQSV